ncbi:hypothetical protein JMJ77_0001495 [Colletotrichum scovillei]|uniref:Uncharacterized protein n=1 Tax=Colletotrichum scovillei TaxID=1209932 RepID=A0A9P7R625_9PEZI|nr:hypothetical protein JMJ77_0001495 [Colletotrichum scovillei]KAG7069904.1 hypothetical protein JMJ76_0001165 [Colletotrichum scovillei]KAG7078152.1 hypothetical protein JMJ78_0001828 [Colletotrichum scovillei]
MHPKFIALTLGSICGVFATLPRTFELLAFENGQRIGCINGYGNFITGSLACYPFNTVGTPVENVAIRGYEPCSASNGSLVCYQAAGPSSLFGLTGADLDLIGNGTLFSADSFPQTSDRVGVPVGVGANGSVPMALQVRGLTG